MGNIFRTAIIRTAESPVKIMKLRSSLLAVALLFVLGSSVYPQKAEITVSFDEQFFDSLLDAVFQNSAPEFSLAQHKPISSSPLMTSFAESRQAAVSSPACTESIKLLRENNSVRTAVRFRDGKIYAPLAFSGSYSPPLVGCVEFSGWAETTIDLQYDSQQRRLIGTARILNVSLNGTGGFGGSIIAKMIQSTIDKKVNPLEIINLDKISFLVPIQNSASIRMRAVGLRHEVAGNILNVHVAFEFLRS